MIFLGLLFILFFFFTHKQMYAGRQFTGSSKVLKIVIKIIGRLNFLLAIAYIVYSAIKVSFLYSASLLIIAYVFLYITNRLICKIVLNRMRKNYDSGETMLFSIYNRTCDIVTTITAIIGIVINLIIIIVFTVNII